MVTSLSLSLQFLWSLNDRLSQPTQLKVQLETTSSPGEKRVIPTVFSMGVPSDDVVLIQRGNTPQEPSIVTVNCPDKTGLGCDICRIILDFGLYITKGGIISLYSRKLNEVSLFQFLAQIIIEFMMDNMLGI